MLREVGLGHRALDHLHGAVRRDEREGRLLSDTEVPPHRGVGVREVGEAVKLVLGRNWFIAGTWSRAATPTNVTFGCWAAACAIVGASAWQVEHHGAQNHSTVGLFARLWPLNSAPASVLELKSRAPDPDDAEAAGDAEDAEDAEDADVEVEHAVTSAKAATSRSSSLFRGIDLTSKVGSLGRYARPLAAVYGRSSWPPAAWFDRPGGFHHVLAAASPALRRSPPWCCDAGVTNADELPLFAAKDYAAPSLFEPVNLLREARRQKNLAVVPVPKVCMLDPDGDVVRHLAASGLGTRYPGWACYHTEMWRSILDGIEVGVIGMAVGGSFAVLVAEQLAASGCELLVSVTSAGQIFRSTRRRTSCSSTGRCATRAPASTTCRRRAGAGWTTG